MNIQINEDVRITSDPFNVIVEIRKVTKSGKNAGEERWEADSYHGSLEQAVQHIHRQNIQMSDSDSVDKLIAVIERSKAEIKVALKQGVILLDEPIIENDPEQLDLSAESA